jgi:predicted carbohydrate-binding protein with CBM5 and CBM33 domain
MHRFSALAFVPLVAAHGFIRSPAPRQPGEAFKAACGEQPFFQQSSDINGNVQGILQVVGANLDAAACNLWLCKGFQYDDNKANVQSFSLGQTIDFDINIAAPHTGVANVSVVKTSTNSIIGTPLIEFDNYAANSGVAANNSAFSVTLPQNLEGECTTAGDCVLQWYWDAPDIDQTYESCVDFTVAGQAGGPEKPATTAAPSATATATATSVAAPTSASATDVITTSVVPAPRLTSPASTLPLLARPESPRSPRRLLPLLPLPLPPLSLPPPLPLPPM